MADGMIQKAEIRRADERSVNQRLMSPYFGDLAEWLCKAIRRMGFSYGGRRYAFPPYMLPPVHGFNSGENWRLRSLCPDFAGKKGVSDH